jgi:hypothetical protein
MLGGRALPVKKSEMATPSRAHPPLHHCSGYPESRTNYYPSSLFPVEISVELLGDLVCALESGKSSGPDNVSAEHVELAHPILVSILIFIFNLALFTEVVSASFCESFTVPIPKNSDGNSRFVTM